MDLPTKSQLKAQIGAMKGMNSSFKALVSTPPAPVMGGMPPMPISLQPALTPYLNALKMHADNFDKLLKVLEEAIDKS